jgi:hypothetical protein
MLIEFIAGGILRLIIQSTIEDGVTAGIRKAMANMPTPMPPPPPPPDPARYFVPAPVDPNKLSADERAKIVNKVLAQDKARLEALLDAGCRAREAAEATCDGVTYNKVVDDEVRCAAKKAVRASR